MKSKATRSVWLRWSVLLISPNVALSYSYCTDSFRMLLAIWFIKHKKIPCSSFNNLMLDVISLFFLLLYCVWSWLKSQSVKFPTILFQRLCIWGRCELWWRLSLHHWLSWSIWQKKSIQHPSLWTGNQLLYTPCQCISHYLL